MELEILLEQVDGYAHSLVAELEILCDGFSTFRMKVQGNFALGLLESERDSSIAQLSLTQGELESK